MNNNNINTPQLRFPEFDGEWQKESLKEYINLISGFAFKGDDILDDNSGTPLLRGINITEGYIRHNKDIDRFFKGNTNGLEKYFLLENDLVLGMDGSKVGKNVALVSTDDVGSLLIQRVARIRANTNSDINYIFQNIFSKKFHRYVDTVNTSSGIPHISSKQINEFKIGFPPLPEQTKIANFLTSVDKRINLLQKKKTELEQYKKGIMQKLFSQEVRFKEGDGSDFPEWEEKKLGEIAKFSKGKGISKKDIIDNGGTECIRYGELYTEYSEIINEIKSRTDLGVSGLVLSEANDVIIPASGETRIDIATACCVAKSGIALGGDLNIIKSDSNGVFLSYYLNNAKKNSIASLAQGVSVVHLYANQLASLVVDIPSKEEQQKIANFLSSIDKSIEKFGNQIEQFKDWKKGLLQKMFV